jgi:hypothetical protein
MKVEIKGIEVHSRKLVWCFALVTAGSVCSCLI